MIDTDATPIDCPGCGAQGRGLLWRGLCVLCDECSNDSPDEVSRSAAADSWKRQVPPQYRAAIPTRVPTTWRLGDMGLGLYGRPGTGKTCAAAVIAQRCNLRIVWVTGMQLRELATAAASADDREERNAAKQRLEFLTRIPLLVIDDISMVKMSEAFAPRLCDLLEQRRNNAKPVIWTANFGPGQLAQHFAKGCEEQLADSIERRLCQGFNLIQL